MTIDEFNRYFAMRYFINSQKTYVLFFQPTNKGELKGAVITRILKDKSEAGTEYSLEYEDGVLFVSYQGVKYELRVTHLGDDGVFAFDFILNGEVAENFVTTRAL